MFVLFTSVYSTPRVSSTVPEKTPFCCPEFACRQKFTPDSWRLKRIKSHNPQHLQIAYQKNLTICSAPRHVEPTQRCEINPTNDSVEDLDSVHYLEHVEYISDSESQPPPPTPPWKETYPGAGTLLSDSLLSDGNVMLMVALRQTYKTIPTTHL